MEDLNVQLGDPCDKHEEELATALVDRGLVNMTDHFLPRRKYQGGQAAGRGAFVGKSNG